MTGNDFFERLETQHRNKHPFVVYRKPNKTVLTAQLQNNTDLIFTEDFSEKGFVFSPFDDTEKTVLMPTGLSEVITCSQYAMRDQELNTQAPIKQNSIPSKTNHINLVEKGIAAINTSDLKKVVLSRTETVTLTDNNPFEIFKGLLAAYKSAFVYCWYHPKVGFWLGATPETLLKIEGNRFSIMALAGTQDYKGTLDVVWQNKEKQEQQYVTDFIVENLKPSVDSFKISDVETVKAGNLLHLKTIISAHLKTDTPLKNIIKVLHPTPAVCGLPKGLAKAFILKNENYKREFYTGFLGELNYESTIAPRSVKRNIENRAYAVKRNSTQLYVNLRCMQLKNKQALIYIGGGITERSDAELEWQETVSKSLVIKSVLH